MRLALLVLLAVLAAPAAAAEPVIVFEKCNALDGTQWADCHGYVPVGGSGGVPYYRLGFGVTTDESCGASSLAGVLEPTLPESGQCWVWAGFLVGYAIVPTPNPDALPTGPA